MPECTSCGTEIDEDFDYCPSCGEAVQQTADGEEEPTQDDESSWGKVAVVLLLLGFIVLIASVADVEDQGSSASTTEIDTGPETDTRYAETNVNVREGPGTDYEVVGQLQEREEITILEDSSIGDWSARYSTTGDSIKGYVSDEYLSYVDPKVLEPDVEIADWRWYKDPDFGTDGATVFVVELKNNTSRYIDQVRVNITTYDDSGNLISSDFTYVDNIGPNGTASEKDYADYFGSEERARIQVGDVRFSR